VSVGKVLLNLCFGAVLPTIKKALATVGARRLLNKNVKLSKRLKLLIKRLNLFYVSSGS
jgi:hypothetical protein